MKKLFFTTLACTAAVVMALAQPAPGGRGPGPRATPQQVAQRKTHSLSKELELTDKQRKKVYKIYLAQAQKLAPDASSHPGGGPSRQGYGPGGHPGGSGGPMEGGRGPGMGGGQRGEGRPEGMRPPMGAERQEGDRSAPELVVEEPTRDIVRRDKKMKRILDARQYARWQELEK